MFNVYRLTLVGLLWMAAMVPAAFAADPQGFAEKQGFVLKKNLSFAIRTVDADMSEDENFSNKDLTLFGPRVEFALKLSESRRAGWFAGVALGVYKGEYDQKLFTGGTPINTSGDVETAFELELFAENEFFLSNRWAFMSRLGLGVNIFNFAEDGKATEEAGDFYGQSHSDDNMEFFGGIGMDYAMNEKSSISFLFKFTLFELTSRADLFQDDSDYDMLGLQFTYSF